MVRAGISGVDDVEVAKSTESTRSEDHEQSREDASQKPYSPSPGAGSRRRNLETCSPDRRCTSAVGTKGTKRRLSYEERRKRNWDDLDAGCRAPYIGPVRDPRILSAHKNLAPRPRKARGRPFTRACRAPASFGPARRASARVWLSILSPFIHDLVSECGFHI
jgi:hypothetical protein